MSFNQYILNFTSNIITFDISNGLILSPLCSANWHISTFLKTTKKKTKNANPSMLQQLAKCVFVSMSFYLIFAPFFFFFDCCFFLLSTSHNTACKPEHAKPPQDCKVALCHLIYTPNLHLLPFLIYSGQSSSNNC